jgi:hypothetical protein
MIWFKNTDRWRAVLKAVMNVRVPQNAGYFLTGLVPVSVSRRILTHVFIYLFILFVCLFVCQARAMCARVHNNVLSHKCAT